MGATLLVSILCMIGCGGSSPQQGIQQPPLYSGSTTVTLLNSASANDQLINVGDVISDITITDQSGNNIHLLQGAQGIYFKPISGQQQPVVTVSIPQGVYTKATISLSNQYFECVYMGNGSADTYASFDNSIPQNSIPLMVPQPIIITGENMGLLLNMQVGNSMGWKPNSCGSLSFSTAISSDFSFTPALTLTAINIPSSPPNAPNKYFPGLFGQVNSVDAKNNNIDLFLNDYATWSISVDGNTVYQGVSSLPQIAANISIDFDATLQPDGTLLANRVEVLDTNSENLSYVAGNIIITADDYPGTPYPGVVNMNVAYSGGPLGGGISSASCLGCNTTTFGITKQFSNVQNLPFPASFTMNNMVPGQFVVATFHELNGLGHAPYAIATTATLLPQTLDGTVSAIGSDGNFTTYTITLAPYDLFTQFAVQPGQTTLLTNPSQVVVYADSNTQMLNTNPIAVSDVVRFYGLVFNDNGTLRMDCAEIFDGVPE